MFLVFLVYFLLKIERNTEVLNSDFEIEIIENVVKNEKASISFFLVTVTIWSVTITSDYSKLYSSL